jgi:hypothetical protein
MLRAQHAEGRAIARKGENLNVPLLKMFLGKG